MPVGGYHTCIGVRPRTLGRRHRYPMSSTSFANTIWHNRHIRHPLSWCFQHPLRLHPCRYLHLSRSGGGWIAGSISGGCCFVSSWGNHCSVNPMAVCILFFTVLRLHFSCSRANLINIHVLQCVVDSSGILGGASFGSKVLGAPIGPAAGSAGATVRLGSRNKCCL